jgi:hypothetical protein
VQTRHNLAEVALSQFAGRHSRRRGDSSSVRPPPLILHTGWTKSTYRSRTFCAPCIWILALCCLLPGMWEAISNADRVTIMHLFGNVMYGRILRYLLLRRVNTIVYTMVYTMVPSWSCGFWVDFNTRHPPDFNGPPDFMKRFLRSVLACKFRRLSVHAVTRNSRLNFAEFKL